MKYDTLQSCMDQRILLLVKISDITKQLEVQSMQADIDLADLPEQRQIYIGRLKKCSKLISNILGKLPDDQKKRLERIIAADFPTEECSEEERLLFESGMKFNTILRETLANDIHARQLIRQECDRLKKQVRSAYHAGKAPKSPAKTFLFPEQKI